DKPGSGGVEPERIQSCARTTPARNKDAAGGSAGTRTSRRSRKQGERPRRFVASAAGGADRTAELVDRETLRQSTGREWRDRAGDYRTANLSAPSMVPGRKLAIAQPVICKSGTRKGGCRSPRSGQRLRRASGRVRQRAMTHLIARS